MNRRMAAGALIFVLAAASLACREPASKPDPVDVLIITIDTLRANALEPYGATDTVTPNAARLAEEGVVYEAATTPITVTHPAHSRFLRVCIRISTGCCTTGACCRKRY